MKIITYIDSEKDFENIASLQAREVLLAPKFLSRKGSLALKKVHQYARKASEQGYRVVLEWDVMVLEKDFSNQIDFFKKIDLSFIASVRCQDIGVLQFLKRFLPPEKSIQLIVEQGNHNLQALLGWEEFAGSKLERIIISGELTRDKVKTYSEKLKTPLEILVLGKVLLFYTPRHLLSHTFSKERLEPLERKKQGGHKIIKAYADSLESAHKNFFVIENRHGSFMYHLKDRCLLDEVEEIKKLSRHSDTFMRIEHLFLPKLKKKKILQAASQQLKKPMKESWQGFKQIYPLGITKGFFFVNKTNILLPKLKNFRLLRDDLNYIGEIADVVKGEYILVRQKSRSNILKVGERVECLTPEGRQSSFVVKTIKDLNWRRIDHAEYSQLVILPYRKTLVAKTIIKKVIEE